MGLVPPPPPPGKCRPPAAVEPPLNPRSVFLELLLVTVLLIGLAFFLPSCATLSNSQPVKVVCASCALLQATGVCGPTSALRAAPCPAGQEPWVVNFHDVVEHGAEPRVECR